MSNKLIQHTSKRSPLTVLHIAPTPFFADRGCHMRIRGLIHALNKLQVRSVVCTYHHGRDIENIETVRTATIKQYTKLEAGPSPYKYLADILLLFKVCGVMWKRKPDIIHGHLHEGSLIGWMAKWIFFWRRIPLIFDVQGSLVGELDAHGYFKKRPYLRNFFWTAEWIITRMPNHFVCSSNQSLQILQNEFNIAAGHLSLVADGADAELPDQALIEERRASLNLPKNKPIVIYTGALLEAKGLNALCELIEAAARDNVNCYFLIVGYPVDEIMKFLEEKQLQASCHLAGRVPYEELSTYLHLADIAIEPKAADSGEASGKLLNYMAAALPVVCYDTPNNREMLSEGGFYAGKHADKNDSEATTLLDCVKHAINFPEEARERGEKSQFRLKNTFSWAVSAENVYNIYRQHTR